MIAWLKSVGHLSYSSIEAWMEDVLGIRVSRSYLAKLCTGTISGSLQPAYEELIEAIPRKQTILLCVIDRKITQGTRGEVGRCYHERMWTTIATCKKQGRSIYAFLLESITAKRNNQPAPSLLQA